MAAAFVDRIESEKAKVKLEKETESKNKLRSQFNTERERWIETLSRLMDQTERNIIRAEKASDEQKSNQHLDELVKVLRTQREEIIQEQRRINDATRPQNGFSGKRKHEKENSENLKKDSNENFKMPRAKKRMRLGLLQQKT